MPTQDEDLWRLGHRRPWWQWNVLTLFAALFVLVWIRELMSVHYVVTWLLCGVVLAVWLTIPMLIQAATQGVKRDFTRRDVEADDPLPIDPRLKARWAAPLIVILLAWLILLTLALF